MPNSHLDDLTLAEYASSSLGEAQSVFVASHLTLCPDCRRVNQDFEKIGGLFIHHENDSPLEDGCFDKILDTIESSRESKELKKQDDILAELKEIPKPIRDKLPESLGSIKWKKLGKNISFIELECNQPKTSMKLMKLSAGTHIPVHSHGGREYTMVLSGGFSDQYGRYERGDVAIRDVLEIHEPVVDEDSECVCFVVTEAPLKIKGFIGFIISKILG